VTGPGIRRRLRTNGRAMAEPMIAVAPALTASRTALGGRERLLIASASIGRVQAVPTDRTASTPLAVIRMAAP
jgi:hypothetical protein